MATTLVIRLSSFGDVAILIPVLYSVAEKNPGDKFLLITKSNFQSLFLNKPSNLEIYPVYTKDQHKGIKGLWKLIQELNKKGIDKIADLHNVLRSKEIDWYFKLKGKKVALIDKGKSEKKELVRKNNKKLRPLTPSIERYQKVFEKLGYDASLTFDSLIKPTEEDTSSIKHLSNEKRKFLIGIAPFAKHTGKIYPLNQMEKVIEGLSSREDTQIFLFGGKDEKEKLRDWEEKYENVQSVAGKLNLEDELLLISKLNVMLTMDSANMHLASLVNTPVVSIWGATHPYAGFYGYKQNPENAVQVDLDCRPCSVFGNKPCYRQDYACMKQIEPERVISKIEKVIGRNS